MEHDNSLTDPAIRAINKYLFKWFAILGITNLAALAIAFTYIFFVLPDRAVNEARSTIEVEALDQAVKIRENLYKVTSEVLVQAGRAQEKADNAKEDSEAILSRIKQIKSQLNIIEDVDLAKLSDIIQKFKNNPEVATSFATYSTAIKLETEMKDVVSGLSETRAELMCFASSLKDSEAIIAQKRSNLNQSCEQVCLDIGAVKGYDFICFGGVSFNEETSIASPTQDCQLHSVSGPDYCCCQVL